MKTLFNINDYCYYLENNKIKKGIINAVETFAYRSSEDDIIKKEVSYFVTEEKHINPQSYGIKIKQKNVFDTKENLLNSL